MQCLITSRRLAIAVEANALNARNGSVIGVVAGLLSVTTAGALIGGIGRAGWCCGHAPDFITGAFFGALMYGVLLGLPAILIGGMAGCVIGMFSDRSDIQRRDSVETKSLPEDVLHDFLIANLNGNEDEIRSLIVEHPDASWLWRGAYPPDVAALLARQYEGMVIGRVEESPERVLLQSSASPIPIAVVRVGDRWRVDASPIIEFRKRAQGDA